MNPPRTASAPSEPQFRKATPTLLRPSNPWIFLLFFAASLFFFSPYGHSLQSPRSSGAAIQEDYDSAQSAQAAGNLSQAATDYKRFLVNALDLLGNNFAEAGAYQHADASFDESLKLDPANLGSRLDYIRELNAEGDLPKARQLATRAVRSAPHDSSTHLALGRVLLQMHRNLRAKQQFEAAVALDPNYVSGLALARADLTLKDQHGALVIFREMRKGFGDAAQLHLDFGLAFAETGYLEQAIRQFKIAIAKNPRLPSAHYSLGAAYLQSMGQIDFPLAEAEFKKELQISPDDFLSYSQLGYIALSQHRFQLADKYLRRAAALNPTDPDVFLSLGQLYVETKQPTKAEAALRNSIALTHDLSRNHYQVQRAHYLLARLLLESGDTVHGQQQMQIAEDLMKKMVVQNQQSTEQKKDAEVPSAPPAATASHPAINSAGVTQVDAYKNRIAPAIADSYNNLGVIAASAGHLIQATGYFQHAAMWKPELPGLNYNLGRAAYYTQKFKLAIPPLEQYVRLHPQQQGPRKWLAASLYATRDYGGVTRILRGQNDLLHADPGTSAMYAESLIQTGDFEEGIQRLKLLESSAPRSSEIHRAIGSAYLQQREYAEAKAELQTAIQLNPKDREAEDDLKSAQTALQNRKHLQAPATHKRSSGLVH